MMSGGEGRGGEGRGEGGVKKCFLSLRQTALLSAEGKKKAFNTTRKTRYIYMRTASAVAVQF
jgi:hypothetical protein